MMKVSQTGSFNEEISKEGIFEFFFPEEAYGDF